jgi:hypothetical protein
MHSLAHKSKLAQMPIAGLAKTCDKLPAFAFRFRRSPLRLLIYSGLFA